MKLNTARPLRLIEAAAFFCGEHKYLTGIRQLLISMMPHTAIEKGTPQMSFRGLFGNADRFFFLIYAFLCDAGSQRFSIYIHRESSRKTIDALFFGVPFSPPFAAPDLIRSGTEKIIFLVMQ